MPRLNLNVDHVATLRQSRGGTDPDPVAAALISELSGSSGIVVHLREDRRHVQERDLEILKKCVQTKLNLEMAATDEMVRIAGRIKPDMATLVPEKRKELTTEGGLNVAASFKKIKAVVTKLKKYNIFVSLFVDPDKEQIDRSKEAGSDMVEIHTGMYANARSERSQNRELRKIENAVNHALTLGLRVSAGHGLNYHNVRKVAAIDGIEELNIGHSIISKSVLVGMEKAVRDMIELID